MHRLPPKKHAHKARPRRRPGGATPALLASLALALLAGLPARPAPLPRAPQSRQAWLSRARPGLFFSAFRRAGSRNTARTDRAAGPGFAGGAAETAHGPRWAAHRRLEPRHFQDR